MSKAEEARSFMGRVANNAVDDIIARWDDLAACPNVAERGTGLYLLLIDRFDIEMGGIPIQDRIEIQQTLFELDTSNDQE